MTVCHSLPLVLLVCLGPPLATAQTLPSVRSSTGLTLLVDEQNTAPTLRVLLPGQPESDRSIEILLPEHVTVRPEGEKDSRRLYLFQPGASGERPAWKALPHGVEYERSLQGDLHMQVTATLEDDGATIRYQFENSSATSYSMVYAATDPRLTGPFHDVRLERTYVHFPEGFRLLAAETPERLTEPLSQWLPARYRASFTWPVPDPRVHRDADGITIYDTARPVDQPMIATRSADGQWVVASFTRTTGNVWSNPELTCQHVDPTPPLPAHGRAVVTLKLLILHGSLEDALARVRAERERLR